MGKVVTFGGVSADGRDWYPSRKEYLFPEKALAKLVRGKLKALLAQKRPDLVAPAAAWKKPWVVHITPWGENVDDTVWRIRGSSLLQLSRQPYAFVFVALVTSSMGFKQAQEVMDQLAEPVGGVTRPYEVVRPDHLIGLIRYARMSGIRFPPG